jgi:hypothetical protein
MKLSFLFLWILLSQAITCLAAAGAAQVFTEPVTPANPEVAGKELVARLLSLEPASSMTNHATLTIHSGKTNKVTVPLRIEVTVSADKWRTTYVQTAGSGQREYRYTVERSRDGTTKYQIPDAESDSPAWLQGEAAVVPMAKSDFTMADIGMEFLHWPNQRLLKKEVRRTQSCDKLESIAPNGWASGYVRVVSWFDIDTGGPVLVEAYDAKGRMVKEFRPTKFQKRNGQYEVEEVEISNLLTKSRSTIRIDAKPLASKPAQAP